MYVELKKYEPTNMLDILVRTHATEIAEAVKDGRDVKQVLLDAAVNTITELQGALARLLEMIPPDVRSTIDIDALIPDPDDNPGEAPPDVEQAALALLVAMAEGDPDDNTTVNLLCNIIDGLRLENEDLRAQLAERDDGGQP